MRIESRRVNLRINPNRVRKIRDAGRQNRLHAIDGSLKDASICTKLVYFFLDLQSDPDVRVYLKDNGGTLLDLILRAVKRYISSK